MALRIPLRQSTNDAFVEPRARPILYLVGWWRIKRNASEIRGWGKVRIWRRESCVDKERGKDGNRKRKRRCLRWQIAVLWKFFAVESTPNALNNILRRMALVGWNRQTPPSPFASRRDNWWSFYSARTMHLITPSRLPFWWPFTFSVRSQPRLYFNLDYLSSTHLLSLNASLKPRFCPIIRRRPGFVYYWAGWPCSARFSLWEIRAISISP